YRVGDKAMEPGGMVMPARHFMSTHDLWQADDPAGNNYISVQSSNAKAKFTATTAPMYGPHGGFRGAQPALAFKLSGATLRKGDNITIIYGDKRGGGKGMKVQSHSSDASPLPVYVSLEPEDQFYSLPIPTFKVLGANVHAVNIFAPSIVRTGEPFKISIRSEDYYSNRATGQLPEYELRLNGRPYSVLPASLNAIVTLPVAALDPGIYRFTIHSKDGFIGGQSNPIWAQEAPEWQIFWGETHGHSGFAEGHGTADGYFKFGRDDAKLDFLTLSEHDIWMDDYEWRVINEAVEKYSEPGKFTVFPGYEWTSPRPRGGHHNVFFRTPNKARVPVHQAPYLEDLYMQLHQLNKPEEVLIIPHAHQAGDWRKSDPDLERLVEIMSNHGTFEWFGQNYLEQGHQVGFIGASDDHLGHPGYAPGRHIAEGTRMSLAQWGGLAAVIAPQNTPDAIFDALRARAAYTTTGSQRIILDVALNGQRMGTRQAQTQTRAFEGWVMGTSPIDTITIFKNNEAIWTKQYMQENLGEDPVFEVLFESDSNPLKRDNPRGHRLWKGWLEVVGADIEKVTLPSTSNPHFDRAYSDEGNSRKVIFDVSTRGRSQGIKLRLKNREKNASIHINLEETKEYGKAPPHVQPMAAIPAAKFTLNIDNMSDTHILPSGRYQDTVTIRRVNPETRLDRRFKFEDSSQALPGDFYYVRVRQLDGNLAWSSPFWVGGQAPRGRSQ
ncbi:MAG: DUF3604 domain-containing protein, partial [Pseudomonadota bacterium]